MSLNDDLAIAHATCPCVIAPWEVTKCRNCGTTRKHHLELCEWQGHAAIRRVVEMTQFDALERIKAHVDRDPAISAEVRKALQRAG